MTYNTKAFHNYIQLNVAINTYAHICIFVYNVQCVHCVVLCTLFSFETVKYSVDTYVHVSSQISI